MEQTATDHGPRAQWRAGEEEPAGEDQDLPSCYVLRSMDAEWDSPEEMWNAYMILTQAEDGSRML